MGFGITNFPEEIILKVLHQLGRKDLCSSRLTCKRLHGAATQTLFSIVRLFPTDESVARYNRILEHPELSTYVRHVELHTLESDDVPTVSLPSTYPLH